MKYLDEEYISLTDEEKAFEATKKNLEKAVKKNVKCWNFDKRDDK